MRSNSADWALCSAFHAEAAALVSRAADLADRAVVIRATRAASAAPFAATESDAVPLYAYRAA